MTGNLFIPLTSFPQFYDAPPTSEKEALERNDKVKHSSLQQQMLVANAAWIFALMTWVSQYFNHQELPLK
jgi:hypothetical protein